MELENKSRFWVGVILIAPEVLVLVIYALGLIDWSFINLMSLAIVQQEKKIKGLVKSLKSLSKNITKLIKESVNDPASSK